MTEQKAGKEEMTYKQFNRVFTFIIFIALSFQIGTIFGILYTVYLISKP